MARAGRPKKTESREDSREKIIASAVEIIKEIGAEAITVRNVCERANVSIGTFYHWFDGRDDLMMTFVRDIDFDAPDCPDAHEDVSGQVTELYMRLLRRYEDLGIDFMKNFYSTTNHALSSYMGQTGGAFAEGTVMRRCEQMLAQAQEEGVLSPLADIHEISEDVCTIVKGCVFEWCLCGGEMDLEGTLGRVLGRYFAAVL